MRHKGGNSRTAIFVTAVRPTFHLPPEASLRNLLWLGDALLRAGNPVCRTQKETLGVARRWHSLPPRGELIDYANRLGIITKQNGGQQLSALARCVLGCPETVQCDLIHFLAYSAWRPEAPGLAPFWSYRHVIDTLFDRREVDLRRGMHDMVEEVIIASRGVFAETPGYCAEKVSFSSRGARGIRCWLRALTPPVITNDCFSRRQTCSAQLIVLALGEAARQAGVEPGSDLLLSQDRREAVCRVCLLDPGYLDRMLDWTLPQFPALLAPGMRGGSYGRSLRLLQKPTVELVCPAREKPQ